MKYLSGEEILIIHSEIINHTGGLHGVRDVHLLASIVEKPKTKLYGKEMYPDVWHKAATYLEALAQYHVFTDGNKRTAVAVAAFFLYKNKKNFKATNKSIVSLALKVAQKQLEAKKVAAWLKKNSQAAR